MGVVTSPATAVRPVEPSPAPVRDPDGFGYRPALDGIRTVAVYLVVLFHSGIALVAGGYVGVDVFFVLSGYLVTSVILAEQRAGAFRPVRFYARRFRRLLPAAAVTLVVSSMLVVALTPRAEREASVGDVRSAFLYVSNWHFLRQAQDYFTAQDLPRPFLHFWSLSIEEQFYFLFPLIVIGALFLSRRTHVSLRRVLVVTLGVTALASVASQWYWSSHDPVRAYYATDARLYQMLAGAVLAVAFATAVRARRRPPPVTRLAGWVALAGILVVASSAVGWSPSRRGFAVTLLAVVMIAAVERKPGVGAARVLATDRMTMLGRISYGTYLWHWPVIFVLRRTVTIGPVTTAAVTCVAATALAMFSSRMIELPIRRSVVLDRIPGVVCVVGVATSAVLGLAVAPALLHSTSPTVLLRSGIGASGPVGDARVPAGVDWRGAISDKVVVPDCVNQPVSRCVLVHGTGRRVLLIGDSHATSMVPAFVRLARERNWTFAIASQLSCPWMQGARYEDPEFEAQCGVAQRAWYERIVPEFDPDVVVLFDRAKDDPASKRPVVGTGALGGRTQTQIIRSAARSTVTNLVRARRRVVMIEPIPVSAWSQPKCLSSARLIRDCAFVATPNESRTEVAERAIAQRLPGRAAVVDIDRLVCPDLPVCLPIVDGLVVRRDGDHLTSTFARHIAERIGHSLDRTGLL